MIVDFKDEKFSTEFAVSSLKQTLEKAADTDNLFKWIKEAFDGIPVNKRVFKFALLLPESCLYYGIRNITNSNCDNIRLSAREGSIYWNSYNAKQHILLFSNLQKTKDYLEEKVKGDLVKVNANNYNFHRIDRMLDCIKKYNLDINTDRISDIIKQVKEDKKNKEKSNLEKKIAALEKQKGQLDD